MCDPATMAATATFLTANAGTISAVSSVAGIGLAASSAYQQGKGQQAQLEYQAAVNENNAKVSEWQAKDAQNRGELEAQRIARAGAGVKGAQRAGLAARGLDLGEGTAFALQEQTDIFSLYDQSTARDNAAKEAWALRQQGSNYSSAASASRATAGGISPGLSAAGTLLTGAGRVADKWAAYGATKS